MTELLRVPSFQLSYEGFDADNHTADAVLIGQSLIGMGRTYATIVNMHFEGGVVPLGAQRIRVHVGSPQEGSLFYAIYLMMVHGQLPLYPDLAFKLAEFAIPKWLKAIIAKRSGQNKLPEKTIDQMHEHFMRTMDFAENVRRDDAAFRNRLLDTVNVLAEQNARPLREMVAPVGRTVKTMEHFKGSEQPVVIDEPTADALRSRDDAVVGDVQELRGKLKAVDTTKGTGKLLIEGQDKPIKIQITDPVLSVPENVYTHALDTQSDVLINAKPLSKNGVLVTLYVSDAKPLM